MLNPKEFIEDATRKIKEEIGDEKTIIALSGGVDSSVCSVLTQEAIGDNLTAIFVNHLNLQALKTLKRKEKSLAEYLLKYSKEKQKQLTLNTWFKVPLLLIGLKLKEKSRLTTTWHCQAVWF